MPQYILCPIVRKGFVTARDKNGIATAWDDRRMFYSPKINDYTADWLSKSGLANGKEWAVAIIPDWVTLSAAALSDPDITIISGASSENKQPITSGKRSTIDSKLAAANLAVASTANDTPELLVTRIVKDGLGHADFSVTKDTKRDVPAADALAESK